LINKTFKQLNAERAGWRAHLKRRSRVFKENQKRLKTTSSQAGGPSPKESGLKQAIKKPQMMFKTILEFEKDE